MYPQQYFQIRQVMSEYLTKGKKSPYKKKQFKRLIQILENIMTFEGEHRLSAIGKRQIIRYWKRTRDENDKTRREKYSILNKFFKLSNPKVTVPEPKMTSE